jgi:hypothetical protein
MKGVSKITGKSPRFIDRTGTRNGRLVFLECLGENNHRHSVWLALCDCGSKTTTTTPSKTMSCGCFRKEEAAKRGREKRFLTDEQRKQRAKANAAVQRKRRASDPNRAMQARISRLHRHALSQVGAIKTSPTFTQLGYSVSEFAKHIERQFEKGMGWQNMGDWQIDHIIPISTAKTVEDVIFLNQLSNLRPLWAKENNAKKNKLLSLI